MFPNPNNNEKLHSQRGHEPVLTPECKNVIKKIFQVDSDRRITAKDLMEDEWVRGCNPPTPTCGGGFNTITNQNQQPSSMTVNN